MSGWSFFVRGINKGGIMQRLIGQKFIGQRFIGMTLAAVFLSVLGSCATSSQHRPGGLPFSSGEYTDTYLGNNTYQIIIEVNTDTGVTTAYQYFQRRASELCSNYEVVELISSERTPFAFGAEDLAPIAEKPRVYGKIKCFSGIGQERVDLPLNRARSTEARNL